LARDMLISKVLVVFSGLGAGRAEGEVLCTDDVCSASVVQTPGFTWTPELMASAHRTSWTSATPASLFREWVPNLTELATEVDDRCNASAVVFPPLLRGFRYPYSVVPNIYFKAGLEHTQCSGVFIGPALVLTVAHCCLDDEGSIRSDIIAVSLHHGTMWQRTARATHVWVPRDGKFFMRYAAPFVDYCFVAMELGPGSYLPVMAGQSFDGDAWRSRKIEALGYPWDGPLRKAEGSITGCAWGDRINMRCNGFGEGASGGPWIHQHEGKPYVVGLNSHREWVHPNDMYSPYFGDDFLRVCRMGGGCGDAVVGAASRCRPFSAGARGPPDALRLLAYLAAFVAVGCL